FSYAGDKKNFNAAAGSSILSVTKATPAFSSIAQTISYGTATTTITGTILGNGLAPSGSVLVTLNGVTLSATILSDGTFSVAFDTSALAAGTYTISFAYAGDSSFNPATGTSTLTVKKK